MDILTNPVLVSFAMLLVIGFSIFMAFRGKVKWEYMISHDGKKASTTKIFQVIGGAVATVMVLHQAITDSLAFDVFSVYLFYVASIDAYTKFMTAKATHPNQQLSPGGANDKQMLVEQSDPSLGRDRSN